MQFYVLQEEDPRIVDVYVCRDDFEGAVTRAVNQALSGLPASKRAATAEAVGRRTRTCTSLREVDAMVASDTDAQAWHEAGRSHDGTRPEWDDGDYRGGNAYLYRQTAASLRNGSDETMGYDQCQFHGAGIPSPLSLEESDPDRKMTTDALAAAISPCETAACVAAHAYVCAKGWTSYVEACVQAHNIGQKATIELGMSQAQQGVLFPATPEVDAVVKAFRITPEDWPCTPERVERIRTRWNEGKKIGPEEMALVLEAIASQCMRTNAMAAAIDN